MFAVQKLPYFSIYTKFVQEEPVPVEKMFQLISVKVLLSMHSLLVHYLQSRWALVGMHLQGHVFCSVSIAKLSFPCASWRAIQIRRISRVNECQLLSASAKVKTKTKTIAFPYAQNQAWKIPSASPTKNNVSIII